MTKAKKNGKKKSPPSSKKSTKSKSTSSLRAGPGMEPAKANYLRMLADPCNAQFAKAPYSGTDSGYYCRTVDFITPSVATAATSLDFLVSYVPNLSFNTVSGSPIMSVTQLAGSAANPLAITRVSNFVTGAASVGKYRPVAACIKYNTAGAYGALAGIIGIGYNNSGHVGQSGALVNLTGFLPTCLKRGGNGTDMFECKWIPNANDELWIDLNGASNNASGGGIFIVGVGVDAVSGAISKVAGLVEITTIWEWTPQGLQGLSMSPSRPTGFTMNQALASITDVGRFIVGEAVKSGPALLSGGLRAVARAAPAMLTLM